MTGPSAKVFGVGFQRTGTSSLVRALDLLGIPSVHNPVALMTDPHHPMLEWYDGFADNPIPLMFRALDARYPGSKFILTDRPVDDWIDSVRWLFTVAPRLGNWGTGPSALAMHRAIYGVTHFDEGLFRARYLRHRAEVLAHFEGRPADLLVIDVTRGEGWDALCPFLDRRPPARPFPHENPRANLHSMRALAWRLRRVLRSLRARLPHD